MATTMTYHGTEVQVESLGKTHTSILDEDGFPIYVSNKDLKPLKKRTHGMHPLTDKHKSFLRILMTHAVTLECTMSDNRGHEFEREYKSATGEDVTVGETRYLNLNRSEGDPTSTHYLVLILNPSTLLKVWWPVEYSMMVHRKGNTTLVLSSKTFFFALLEQDYRLGPNKPKQTELEKFIACQQ